ncbi:Malonyl-CoA decarboxylase, mitochondrial [Linum grandiflorum]
MNKKGLAILMRARMRAAAASAADAPPSPATNNTNTNLSLTAVAAAAAARNSEAARSHGDADHLSKLPVNSATVTAFQRDLDVVRDAMHSAISLNKTQVLDSVLDVFSQGYVGLSRHDRRSLLLILAKGYDLNRIHARELMNQHLGLQLQLTAGDGTESSSPHDEAMLSAFYRIERNLRQALKPAYDVLFERLNTHPGGLRFLSNLRADVLAILQDENVASLRALDTCLKEKLTTWLSPFALELHHITWDDPASLLEKIVAYEAGLAGINLGKFLIKRVITLVKRDMPHISNLLEPAEESLLMNSSSEAYAGKSGTEVLLNILTSNTYDWASNAEMLSALKSPLMRLCARYSNISLCLKVFANRIAHVVTILSEWFIS